MKLIKQILSNTFDRTNPDNRAATEKKPDEYRCQECGHEFHWDELIRVETFSREKVCPDCLGDVVKI